jgi:hypothetical protein
VYSHDVAGGVFADLDEAKKKNIDDEKSELYSILYNLESMRNSDKVFHFLLCYPELKKYSYPCNEWKQSSNPVVDSTISGFEAITLTFPKNGEGNPFGGLGLSPLNFVSNLIDDTPDHTNWFNPIGTLQLWGGQIPGPELKGVKMNVLYVKISPSM